MKAYFAGQCGAALGALVGTGVAICLDKMDKNDSPISDMESGKMSSDQRAMICITAGAAVGGLAAIFAVSK